MQVRLRFEQERFYRTRTLIERAPFAWALLAEDICGLVEASVTATYAPGDTIFSESDAASLDRYYLVAEGTAVETRGDVKHRREVGEYGNGDGFCEWALYSDPEVALEELRSNSVVTAGPKGCTCVCIDRLAFTLLIGPYEDLVLELQARASGPASNDRRGHHHPTGRAPARVGRNAAHGRHDYHRRKSSPEPLDMLAADGSGRWSPRRRMRDATATSPRGRTVWDGSAVSPRKKAPVGDDSRASPRRKSLESLGPPELPPPKKLFNDGERRRQRIAAAASAAAAAGAEGDHSLPSISEGGGPSVSMATESVAKLIAGDNSGTPESELSPRGRCGESGEEQFSSQEGDKEALLSVTAGFGIKMAEVTSSSLRLSYEKAVMPTPKANIDTEGLEKPVTLIEGATESFAGRDKWVGNFEETDSDAPDSGGTLGFSALSKELAISNTVNEVPKECELESSQRLAAQQPPTFDLEDRAEYIENIVVPDLADVKDDEIMNVVMDETVADPVNEGPEGTDEEDRDIPSEFKLARARSMGVVHAPQKPRIDDQIASSHESQGNARPFIQAGVVPTDIQVTDADLASTIKSGVVSLGFNTSFGRYPFDFGAAPGTPGELPKTPGGTVLLNTQGRAAAPPFKSPSITPSQSRVGSSHGLPLDRRTRSTTSHAVTSADEFSVPSAVRRRGSDDDFSDDGEAPIRAASRGTTSQSAVSPGTVPKIRLRKADVIWADGQVRPKSMLAMATDVAATKGGTSTFPSIREIRGRGSLKRDELGITLGEPPIRQRSSLLAPFGPGPGAYDLAPRRDLGCVRIGLADRRFVWDETHRVAARLPGPGQYNADIGSIQARVAAKHIDGKLHLKQRMELQARFSLTRAIDERSLGGDSLGKTMSFLEETVLRCIEKHGGQHYSELPQQSELCYELRSVDAVRRAYQEHGIDL